MTDSLVRLDALPSAADFYAEFWNRRPFLVRGAVAPAVLAGLIRPDELAALAMEETVQARMVTQSDAGTVSGADWSVRQGPFAEKDFDIPDDPPWSLLVQNVEQFHPGTARLLRAFGFAPRWLMDDVMVSFSTRGGGIGGHVDSYHVFLVQGQGARRWTVGREPVTDEVYIDNPDLKILKDPIDGDSVDVGPGDVLYVPPRFAHEGATLEDALTFSVGFLGPKLSDLMDAWGGYVAENVAGNDAPDARYTGAGLRADSAGFTLSADAVDTLRAQMADALHTPAFADWLARYFTDDAIEAGEREDALGAAEFSTALQAAGGVVKPAYVKFALVPSATDSYSLGVHGRAFAIGADALPVVLALMTEDPVTVAGTPGLMDHADLLHALHSLQALEFAD